ncbi:CASP-like protein 3A1 [Solanum dulcamara]|uniref:CASP-like protein 3A1 n=1 Tax=Solanum dulcamara TaxID=45834 RepID=UPI0024859987|nr:CASP-like protein 3A1 [Solanum dulcamara]
MINGGKNPPDIGIQLPEMKLTVTESSNGPPDGNVIRKAQVMQLVLRALCLVTSVTALSLMVTAEQASTISVFGFNVPLHSKWSFSHSFEYLVGVLAVVALHLILQLLISGSRLVRGSPIISSRNHGWLIFAGDQVFTLALMSAGSSASSVSSLNHSGIRHTALPNFCKPLHRFCDRVSTSIVFTFFSCFLLAILVVLDVLWLSRH